MSASDDLLHGIEGHVGLLNQTKDKYYKLADIMAIPGVEICEPMEGKVWVAVVPDTEENVWVKFAAFEWATEDDDAVYLHPLFVGHGTGGALRELRHTYWGPDKDGYIFYMPLSKCIAALECLKKYFEDEP